MFKFAVKSTVLVAGTVLVDGTSYEIAQATRKVCFGETLHA